MHCIHKMLNLKYVVLYLSYIASTLDGATPAWSWNCVNDANGTPRCIREKAISLSTPPVSETSCHQTCSPTGTLVPRPKNLTLGKEIISFLPSQIRFSITTCQNICEMLKEAYVIMTETLNKYHPKYGKQDLIWGSLGGSSLSTQKLVIDFSVSGTDIYLNLSTNESYTLEISTIGTETTAKITAPTFFGARHALETLSQLIAYNKENNALQMVSSGYIDDSPAFPYRGLIIDTARNFLPVENLKRIIDGMSYNKLNSFHWHITDTQSFPMNISKFPKMAFYGTYSPEEVYTRQDVQDIVQYARIRGIRVLPEFDAPAHVGHGWQWGEEEGLGPLVVCLDKQPWNSFCVGPPCGQMNLANENLYVVLKAVYDEMIQMFGPIDMFHYGGDEIHLNCWNSSEEMSNWMRVNGFGVSDDAYYQQWANFQERARQLLTAANAGLEVPGILWTSHLTEAGRASQYLDKNKYIIQVWTTGTDPLIKELLEKGFDIIMSNYDALYFDCGVSSWVGKGTNWCSPYKGWQDVYDNDIAAIARNLTNSSTYDKQVLGGEGAAWSEQIDENTIDAKLWPRGAALAERLWTNPTTNYASAESRMLHHRRRLVQRGLKAARLQPEWCSQNEGQCPI